MPQPTTLPGNAELRPSPSQYRERHDQHHYVFSDGGWEPVESGSVAPDAAALSTFSVMSWNVDFMRPLPNERMKAALGYLGTYELRKRKSAIIMFSEMVKSDLQAIQVEDWVRQDYYITDLTGEKWVQGYGTCMLIPKSMSIKDVFRVVYRNSKMGRDALFVDIALPENKNLRVCATHLESLRCHPPRRPSQLAKAAEYMKEADSSILAGDLNAIEDFDKTLHLDNDLKDAYLESGGEEGAADGMTWGQMATTQERDKFGLGRLDKIFFHGGLELGGFRAFGMDVVLEGDEADDLIDGIYGRLEKAWVTDHLGIMADFRIVP